MWRSPLRVNCVFGVVSSELTRLIFRYNRTSTTAPQLADRRATREVSLGELRKVNDQASSSLASQDSRTGTVPSGSRHSRCLRKGNAHNLTNVSSPSSR